MIQREIIIKVCNKQYFYTEENNLEMKCPLITYNKMQ